MRMIVIACLLLFPGIAYGQGVPAEQMDKYEADASVALVREMVADTSHRDATLEFGCSGVVIAIDGEHAYGLSAAHCCRVGSTFEFETSSGGTGWARWIAEDATTDLSLFKLWAKDVSAAMPVYREVGGDISQKIRAVGHGRWGLKLLDYAGDKTINRGMLRSEFAVRGGTFRGGDSGSGVVAYGGVVGIITHGSGGSVCYAARHGEIVEFLDAEEKSFGLLGKLCRQKRDDCCGSGSGNSEAPPPPGDGIRPPDGSWSLLDSDADRRAAIAALQEQVAELQKQIANQSPIPVPDVSDIVAAQVTKYIASIRGDLVGQDGKPGKDGENGNPGRDGIDGRAGQSGIGKDGAEGLPGPSGTVTIVLIGADGKEIRRVSNVESGSVARVRLTRVLESEK